MFANASLLEGGLVIAVPGELRGYGALHRRYGRLKWKELVEPAAKLARRGYRVSKYMNVKLNIYSDKILAEPSMREMYVNPKTGKVWKVGDIIKERKLAETLDVIAEEGPEALHNGSLTKSLVRDIRRFGGIITKKDLNNYNVKWDKPITISLSKDHTLYTTPLPGSGSVLAFILNMVNGWIGRGTEVPSGSNRYWHRVMETFKYAYAKRTGLGDPSHSGVPFNIRELERNLTNPVLATAYRNLVDDRRTFNDWKHYGAIFGNVEDRGTAHVIVIAPDGSVVSVTSSINFIWGSMRRSRSLGIILNNNMRDFAIPRPDEIGSEWSGQKDMPPSPANMIAPGLQPLSSMVPSIVLSKQGIADLVIGAAGGMKITTQVALAVMQNVMEGESLQDAIDRPSAHHQLSPMEVQYERNFDAKVLASLRAKGHITKGLEPLAVFVAINGVARREDGSFDPVADRGRASSISGL